MKRKTVEEVISDFKSIHGDKYDYSMITEYVNKQTKMPIICPIHGVFYMDYAKHFTRKHGCSQCNGGVKVDIDYYIKKAKTIHGDKYDYSKAEYINSKTKVCIMCPIHGEFWQSMSNHCHKTKPQGCPFCKESRLESFITLYLSNNDINFEKQKRFDWLGRQSLDFYLPQYDIAIECQGEQHFKCTKTSTFFNEEKICHTKALDIQKKKLCDENGIKLLYYSNLGIDYPYFVFEDVNELIKTIKEHGIQ